MDKNDSLWQAMTGLKPGDHLCGIYKAEHMWAEQALRKSEKALRRRTAQLEALREAELEIAAQLDLDAVLRSIALRAGKLLENAKSSLHLYRPEQDILELVAFKDALPPLQRGEGLAGKILETGRPLIVDDYAHWKGRAEAYEPYPILTAAGVPVRCGPPGGGEEFLGVLVVWRDTPGPFSPADIELLEMFATHAAIAINNARLMEQVHQDARARAKLLREVNHRLRNNLSTLISIINLEQNRPEIKKQPDYQGILQDMGRRIQGLAKLHQMLQRTDWSPLRLDDLAGQIIKPILYALPPGKRVSVDLTPSDVQVDSKQAHKLALVINELATNAVKYALGERPSARISVRIARQESQPDTVLFEFRDDGPGYPEDVLCLDRYNVGLDLVRMVVCTDLGGVLTLSNNGGAVTAILFNTNGKL